MKRSGNLLSLFRWRPRPQRSADEQKRVDAETELLALYHFAVCPYCTKVRRAIKRLGLNIELRNAAKYPLYEQELRQQGGKLQTPCLRIQHANKEVEWLYESADIVRYLEQRFNIRKSP